MARYQNALVNEFAAQLARGPKSLKWKQTVGAERLFRIVQPANDYPYEIVTDYITKYRPRGAHTERPLIPGRQLLHDLPLLIEQVADSAWFLADEVRGEPVFTIEDLARRFGVSTKTVNRWRLDGLIGRKMHFPDGKTRVGFLAGSVEHFVNTRGDRVRRGQQFSRLSAEERSDVLDRARRMAARGNRQEVIERIAAHMGRSVETVRYVIGAWDSEHPTRAIFPDRRRTFTAEQFQQIYDGYKAGQKPAELACRFGCGASTIYRAICQVRSEELRTRKPTFLMHASFESPGAEAAILHAPTPEQKIPAAGRSVAPADALPYLKDVWGAEVLSADTERALFRRYNFLKYLAARDIGRIESSGLISGRQLDRIDEYLRWTDSVRDRLIRANLRLVISIAKKHHGPMTQLPDLISDGNMVLLRAIEKFDFSRGQKFSTYCSWAVMKHFARSIPETNYQRRWAGAIEPELWQQVARDKRVAQFMRPRLDRVRAGLEEGLAVLPPRERVVLVEHYGLDGDGGAGSRGKTLSQIGRILGVTKERVRQIEGAALVRLRKLLGADVLEELALA